MQKNKMTAESKKKYSRIVLAGNPNVGKSVIFGLLTGQYATVSNYPGTTVEVSSGNIELGGKKFLLIDSPGVNSFIPMSEDERVTRDILLGEKNENVVLVADSKNLKSERGGQWFARFGSPHGNERFWRPSPWWLRAARRGRRAARPTPTRGSSPSPLAASPPPA
jgi:tRNA U34 5-carboxymethylaminomethyl modifying GTPase MnmE/TrmE